MASARNEVTPAIKAGRIIREARDRNGLSRRAVETISGVSQPTIQRLENGYGGDVKVATISAIAAVVGLDREETQRVREFLIPDTPASIRSPAPDDDGDGGASAHPVRKLTRRRPKP